jgi:hypothetical protein
LYQDLIFYYLDQITNPVKTAGTQKDFSTKLKTVWPALALNREVDFDFIPKNVQESSYCYEKMGAGGRGDVGDG